MTDWTDLLAATQAVTNPGTAPVDLAAIAQSQPTLQAQVAAHPNAYPGLLDWLSQRPSAASRGRRLVIASGIIVVLMVCGGAGYLLWDHYHANRTNGIVLAEHWDMVEGGSAADTTGYVGAYYDKVTFTVSDETHNGDGTGAATVTVTTPDLRAVFDGLLSQMKDSPKAFTSAGIDTYLSDTMTSADCPMTSTTISVALTKVGRNWKIVPDDAWNTAISGGIDAVLIEHFEAFQQEMLSS